MGTRLLSLRQQLFEHGHLWKAGEINRKHLRQQCRPIRAEFEQTLRQVLELGHERKEQTPWSQTVRTCQHDDQPWLIPAAADDEPRLLRGGSWSNYPRFCRSAYRLHFRPGLAYGFVVFRVVCLPQGPSLNS
jgi:hypothetical protein